MFYQTDNICPEHYPDCYNNIDLKFSLTKRPSISIATTNFYRSILSISSQANIIIPAPFLFPSSLKGSENPLTRN